MSAVSLLYEPGMRPQASDIRRLAASDFAFSISFDPAVDAGKGAEQPGDEGWLELMSSGLTFDLSGLAPGPGEPCPARGYEFGLPPETSNQNFEALSLRLGPHLMGGKAMLPVVRCLAGLAATMSDLPGTKAVIWHPARSWCAPAHFRNTVRRWIEGGAFPGLGLTALAPLPDGSMQSEGLELFIGQELRIGPDVAQDRAAGAQIGLRLLHWLVENGRLSEPETLTGPGGEILRLEPSRDGQLVEVWKG